MNISITQNVTQHSPQSFAIINGVKDYMPLLKGKFMFDLIITIPSIGHHQTRYDTINANSLIRALSNGKYSMHSVDNRAMWQSQIIGSCYRIYVNQFSPDANVDVTYRLLCLTNNSHVDDNFRLELQQRVKKIYPNASVIFHDVEILNSTSDFEKRFARTFNHRSLIYLDSKAMVRMENNTRRWVIRSLGSDYFVNGCVHKYVRISYEFRHLEGQ